MYIVTKRTVAVPLFFHYILYLYKDIFYSIVLQSPALIAVT